MCDVQCESVTFWTYHLRELLADYLDFSDVKIHGSQVVVEMVRPNKEKENTTA